MNTYKPYMYQQNCIDRIISQKRVGLFLDMGLGKTVVTLTAIYKLMFGYFEISKVLVIAPKRVAEGTWMQEKDKWSHLSMLHMSLVSGTAAQRKKALYSDADIYVIGRDNITWLVDFYKNAWPYDMIVIDESSSFKSPSTRRFKSLARVSMKSERLVELTGTPSPNGMEDLWSQMYLLDAGERLESRYAWFRAKYFTPGARNSAGIVYKYQAKEGSSDAILKKIADICVSMKSEDYLQLPDMVIDDIPVILDAQAAAAYKELSRNMILSLPDDDTDISVTSAAALSNKLLQLANGALYDEEGNVRHVHDCKLEAYIELVESLNGQPLLTFYSFIHDRDRISAALASAKIKFRILNDSKDIEDWNSGKITVLLAHPASCAYGLNLQDGGHHICWFGLTWNFEQYSQANKRLHRNGQHSTVFVHRLLCKGTRDDDVEEALEHKDLSQQYVMDSLKARIKAIKEEIDDVH